VVLRVPIRGIEGADTWYRGCRYVVSRVPICGIEGADMWY